jgi:hypothetical protein
LGQKASGPLQLVRRSLAALFIDNRDNVEKEVYGVVGFRVLGFRV